MHAFNSTRTIPPYSHLPVLAIYINVHWRSRPAESFVWSRRTANSRTNRRSILTRRLGFPAGQLYCERLHPILTRSASEGAKSYPRWHFRLVWNGSLATVRSLNTVRLESLTYFRPNAVRIQLCNSHVGKLLDSASLVVIITATACR
jgi:hypothetical protein